MYPKCITVPYPLSARTELSKQLFTIITVMPSPSSKKPQLQPKVGHRFKVRPGEDDSGKPDDANASVPLVAGGTPQGAKNSNEPAPPSRFGLESVATNDQNFQGGNHSNLLNPTGRIFPLSATIAANHHLDNIILTNRSHLLPSWSKTNHHGPLIQTGALGQLLAIQRAQQILHRASLLEGQRLVWPVDYYHPPALFPLCQDRGFHGTDHWGKDKVIGVGGGEASDLLGPPRVGPKPNMSTADSSVKPSSEIPCTNHDGGLERKVTAESGFSHHQHLPTLARATSNAGGTIKNNPSFTHHAASESVVPDLMEVYDALTQSSTPQTGAVPPPKSVGDKEEAKKRVDLYSNKGGKQLPNPPSPAPPPIVDSSTRSSYRSRTARSGSSDGSYSDSTGSKRKSSVSAAEIAKTRRAKKMKSEDPQKKSAPADSRWSKRFTWPDELHRDFVAAVFDVGLKHSSPSSIMEHMKLNADVTSERVKSHLQKYRLNRQKSRNEFMASYDSALEGFQKHPHDFDEEGDHSFSCGEVAALLTHSIQMEGKAEANAKNNTVVADPPPTQGASNPGTSAQDPDGVSTLHLPLLTEEERESPLGQSFGYLVGMFQTLTLELEMKRQQQEHSNPHPMPSTNPNVHGVIQLIPPQQQHPTTYYRGNIHPQSIEQAAATAASLHVADPSIHEVANVIPHAIVMGGSQGVYSHGLGLYRLQSHGVQHEQQQYQYAGASSQQTFNPPQARLAANQTATQEYHNSPMHNNYHHAQHLSTHASHQTYHAPANSSSQEQTSTQSQHLTSATTISMVPCPLESSGSPGNAPGHGTGRTLQAQKESSIMKQEMKSQKAFQNKMRALKQVELNKYSGREQSVSQSNVSYHGEDYVHESLSQPNSTLMGGDGRSEMKDEEHEHNVSHSPLHHDEGLDHDFWNSQEVNDQLFDFLMDS
ncbi:hypothetical protein HJC23_012192 [Cyclotella cryptica]|uniref:HTH myb-type domain-containing protein n=1 Tax=Cyclotella cryptica TaxID=29204 RepID=A0ABD3PV04_9STRA|eukprot:CCRYP_011221-RA/>CCRYP_011221-RA protein AED:0.17 eAED:0.17 QI:9/1/1/1/1/1/2/2120/930